MRLPGCFLCYTPAPDAPPVAPAPALANGFVTFGSFNALAKETPEVRCTALHCAERCAGCAVLCCAALPTLHAACRGSAAWPEHCP